MSPHESAIWPLIEICAGNAGLVVTRKIPLPAGPSAAGLVVQVPVTVVNARRW